MEDLAQIFVGVVLAGLLVMSIGCAAGYLLVNGKTDAHRRLGWTILWFVRMFSNSGYGYDMEVVHNQFIKDFGEMP